MSEAPVRRGRLLTVADHLGSVGGTEVAQLHVFEGLSRLGWDVELLYVSDGDLSERWRALATTTERIRGSLPVRGALVSSTWAALRAARRARHARPDLVYLHSAGDVPLALAARKLRRTPVVVHIHVPPPSRQPGWLNALIARTDAVITPAADTATRWAAVARLSPSRLSVVPTGVDLSRYTPIDDGARAEVRAGIGVERDERMVLFVGRLEAIKGPALLVDAMSRLHSPAHLVLCGGDGRDVAYVAALHQAAAGARVTFLGRRSDVAALMGAADLVVLPSNVAEPQPLVIAEALACGTPVVASDIGGIGESLAGFVDQLVAPGDVERLAAAVAATVGWRTDQPDLGARSRQWASEHLSLEGGIDAVDRLLLEVLGRRR